MICPRPFVWPSLITICKPRANTTCSTIADPLIVLPVVIVPDVKQREFVIDIVPVSELPVWPNVANNDPLRPSVELHVPCHRPAMEVYCMTLKVAVAFPPPDAGFVTTIWNAPAMLRSD
jgi:hypothetical protein